MKQTQGQKEGTNISNVLDSFPNSVPITIEGSKGVKILFSKLMVSNSLSSRVIWRYLLSKYQRKKSESITIWIKEKGKSHILTKELSMREIYEKYRNEDGFIQLKITRQEVFG